MHTFTNYFKKTVLSLLVLLGAVSEASAVTYCNPTNNYGNYNGMQCSNFVTSGALQNISYASGGTNPQNAIGYYVTPDHPTQVCMAAPGSTITLSMGGGNYSGNIRVWIDYNVNGSFTDANEQVASISSGYGGTYTATFTVPPGTPVGLTRLRVGFGYQYNSGTVTPCNAPGYGQFQDYDFIVAGPCTTPTSQPTGLALTIAPGSISGVITPVITNTSISDHYLTVRTPGTAAPSTPPVNGTAYTVGATLGNATVVSTGATFTDVGTVSLTQYTYTVYAYNSNCTAGPLYNTVSPLSKSTTASYTGVLNIPLTGFNMDAIANGVGPVSGSVTGTTGLNPNSGYFYDAADFSYTVGGNTFAAGANGLPISGIVGSLLTPGLTWKFANYTGNNDLFLPHVTSGSHNSGTLVFGATVATPTLYVLMVASNGSGGNCDAVVNFTDGTTQSFPAFASNMPDWVGGNPAVNAVTGLSLAVVNVTTNVVQYQNSTYLSQYAINLSAANATKNIASVTFTNADANGSGGCMSIWAISALTPCAAPTAQATALSFTAAVTGITGSYTPAASATNYLVVRTPGTTAFNGVGITNGTNYAANSSIGNGTVIYFGPNTSFTDGTVASLTQYTYTIIAANTTVCSGGPVYYTVNPLSGSFTSAYNGAVSVPVTGFNYDMIANGTGQPVSATVTNTSTGFDVGGNSYYVSADFSNSGIPSITGGLPVNGRINSAIAATPGLGWQLANYTGNNCLWLPRTTNNATGTLTLVTPVATNTIWVLASSGSSSNPYSLVNGTINFTDGTNQPFTFFSVPDWTTAYGYSAMTGIMGVNSASGTANIGTTIGASHVFNQYPLVVSPANTSKLVASVTFTNSVNPTNSIGGLGIWALTVLNPCQTPVGQASNLVLTPITGGGGMNVSFTGATIASNYFVVRTPGTTAFNAGSLVNGNLYTVRDVVGNGVVVYNGPGTSFVDGGLDALAQYTYTVFTVTNSMCSTSPVFNTVSPLTGSQTSLADNYISIPISGFTQDLVANGINIPLVNTVSTTNSYDGPNNPNGNYYTAADYTYFGSPILPGALPMNGYVQSPTTPGLFWQLANYTGPNVAWMPNVNGSNVTVTLNTQITTTQLYVLGAAGGATNNNTTALVNFADGSTQSFSLSFPDWSGGGGTVMIGNMPNATGGVYVGYNSLAGTTNTNGSHFLYVFPLALSSSNYSKPIVSIKFTNNITSSGQGDPGIWAISANGPCNGAPTAPTITSAPLAANICAGGNTTINATDVNTAGGIYYVWQQAPAATGPWTTVVGGSGNLSLSYTTNGLASPTYFRLLDSCGFSHLTTPSTTTFFVPVTTYSLPYFEPFVTTSNGGLTQCFTENYNNSSNTSTWKEYDNYKSADGTVIAKALMANDPANNSAGKNEYFTIPALSLLGGVQYKVSFGYMHGKDPSSVNNSAYPENLTLYVSNPIAPGVVFGQAPPNGQSIFNALINFDNPAKANVLYTAPNNGPYYFSWYTNTSHPFGQATVPGGTVAVDSIRVDSVGCISPTINFQPLATVVCVGSNATFAVNAIALGIAYQWQVTTNGSTYTNITDGAVPGATGSTYVGTATGTLTVQAAGTPMSGWKYRCVISGTCLTTGSLPAPATSNTVMLTVSAFPTATITAGGATAICPGSTVNLNSNTTAGFTYQWNLNNTSLVGANASTYAAGAPGNYTVTVTNTNGCSITSAPTTVTQNPAPPITITASGPTTFCTGSSVTLTANTGTNITYQWFGGAAGTTPYGLPVSSQIITTSGIYKLTETNTTDGCTATYPVPINVIVNGPTVATSTAGGPTTFCLGGFVSLNGNTGSGYTYQWQVSNNGAAPVNITGATAAQSSYSAANTGVYDVVITQNGCSLTSNTNTVTVNSPSTVVTQSGSSICNGNSVTMSAVVNANYTYQWSNGGTLIPAGSGGTASSYTTNVAGSYVVAIHDASSGCSASSNPIVLVASTPPAAYITATGPTTFCSNSSVTLYSDTASSYSYQWAVDSGYGYVSIPAPTGTVYAITTSHSGNYKVTITNGCSTTSLPVTVTAVLAPFPVIIPNGLTALCPNNVVTLTTGTGAGLTYQWSNSAGPIANATNTSYTTGVGDTYIVQVTNNNGCVGTASMAVTNSPLPDAHISASGPTTFCAGNSVSLNVAAATGNTYNWKLNGNSIYSASGSYNVSAPGTYQVTVTSAAGCSATSQDTIVHVLVAPAANVTPAGITNICSNADQAFTVNNINNNTSLTYQWLRNSSPVPSGGTGSVYTASTPGQYSVVVTDTNSCSDTSAITILNINPAPTATVFLPSADTAVCQGNTVIFAANLAPSYGYQWQRNGTNIVGATLPVYQATQSGTYTVTTYLGSCATSSTPRILTVNQLPASDTISYTGAPSICAGSAAALQAPSGSGYNYQWMINGGTITAATSENYGATVAGAYTVRVTTGAGCMEVTQPLTVNSYPEPNPGIIAYGTTLTTGTFVTYQWYYNNAKMPGATTNSIVATLDGPYSVFVTDANGCSKMSAVHTVTDVSVANVYGKDAIKIYPNPATSLVHIDAPVKVNVSIAGIDGRVLIQQNNAVEVNINNLANGTYIITITDESNAVIKIDKLVKTGM